MKGRPHSPGAPRQPERPQTGLRPRRFARNPRHGPGKGARCRGVGGGSSVRPPGDGGGSGAGRGGRRGPGGGRGRKGRSGRGWREGRAAWGSATLPSGGGREGGREGGGGGTRSAPWAEGRAMEEHGEPSYSGRSPAWEELVGTCVPRRARAFPPFLPAPCCAVRAVIPRRVPGAGVGRPDLSGTRSPAANFAERSGTGWGYGTPP